MLQVTSNSPSAPPALRRSAGAFWRSAACRLSPLTVGLALLLGATAAGPQAVAGGSAVSAARPESALSVAAVAPIAPIAPVGRAVQAALRGAAGLSPRALAMALDAISCARARGVAGRDDLLTLIDYTLPSTAPRLWVLDLLHGKVLFHELVAHGAGSGDKFATRFSNTADSRQSSLGLFLTGGTYEGGNGYSLKLRGLDAGLNDRAEERNIVIHGAWYVTADHAQRYGRLGRSWGCPALPQDVARGVIDAIKGGSFVYSYAGSSSQVAQAASRAASRCPAPGTPASPQARTSPAPTSPLAPSVPLATAIATAIH
jgi:hypothetical protein